MKQKLFSMLVLLLMAATGAWAQTETLLTTITPTGKDTYSETPAGVVTVTPSNMRRYSGDYGWLWGGSGSVTVEAKEGYTITRCVFKQNAKTPVTISTSPFAITFNEDGRCVEDASQTMNGVTSIEVYGPAAAATGYSVTLAEGTEDFDKWTIEPKTGLSGGETVIATYKGDRKVKSVKAVKKEVGPEVSTFSELQAALSAGKDVKLMNDIVCTAEIKITSGALTIDGNGKKFSTTSAIRAFNVESSATVAFKNLTLTGFVNGGGPAINNSGTIVLDGCTISNCHVNNSNGGGAIESSGKLYAINTTFSGNYSGEIGGAINNYGGSLYMIGCTFTNNYTTQSRAYYGGAIGINGGSEIRLINCSFSGNKYGTNTGANDIGVYNKPTNDNYTIAGCTGATIASRADVGDITTNASGTATLDYSDLSNISFTYKVPVTVTWNKDDITGSGKSFTKDGVTITVGRYIDFDSKEFAGGGTFTTTLGNFTKIEVSARRFRETGTGWSGSGNKGTWTGNASSVSFNGDIIGSSNTKFVFTIEPTN